MKPLDGMGGTSVFRVRESDPNRNVIVETVSRHGRTMVMVQRYLPEIVDGDKRILLIGGEVVPYCLARIPKPGETRGNLAAGGRGEARPLTPRDREIAEALAPALWAEGLLIVGLDVIGPCLTEVNVTSPTCFVEIAAADAASTSPGLFADALSARRGKIGSAPFKAALLSRAGYSPALYPRDTAMSLRLEPARTAFAALASPRSCWQPPPCGAAAAARRRLAQDDPAPAASPPATWSHAYAAYGAAQVPARLQGTSTTSTRTRRRAARSTCGNPDRRTSFDKFNPYTIKGSRAGGRCTILMFESLAVRSGDEPGDDVRPARRGDAGARRTSRRSRSASIPKARFNNGDPVLAADVKHSFDMLTSKGAAPGVRAAARRRRAAATVLDERTIRFDLKERTDDTIFNVGGTAGVLAQVGRWARRQAEALRRDRQRVPDHQRPVHDRRGRLAAARIDFERDPNYWARDLGVRQGPVQLRPRRLPLLPRQRRRRSRRSRPASSTSCRSTRRGAGRASTRAPKWGDGRIVKEVFDVRLRAGLPVLRAQPAPAAASRTAACARRSTYAYDFETINVYKQYKRTNSLFANSEFAATGMPSPGELALLEPFRDELPPEVFGPPCDAAAHRHRRPTRCARTCKKARALLEEAGWKLDADGVAAQRQGRAVRVRVPRDRATRQAARGDLRSATSPSSASSSRCASSTSRSTASGWRRSTSTWSRSRSPDFALPDAAELKDAVRQRERPTSRARTTTAASRARRSTRARQRWTKAKTMEELRDAARALDRVVMLRALPGAATCTRASNRVSRWDKFGIPQSRAEVLHDRHARATGSQWAVTAWWIKDAGQGRRPRAAPQRKPERRNADLHPQAPAADDPDAARRADAHLRRHPVRAGRAGRAAPGRGARRRAAARARRARPARRDVDAKQIEELKKLYGFDKPPLRALLRDARQLRALRPRARASCTTRTSGSSSRRSCRCRSASGCGRSSSPT